MVFWSILYCMAFLLLILQVLLPKYNIAIFFMSIITLISAFRYNIGWDYFTYETMYYNLTFDLNNLYPEYSFQLLCEFFNNLGFNSQIIFFIYAVLTGFFIYKGARYYCKSNIDLFLACLFFFFLIWWKSTNTIRQILAVSIVFYGFRYLLENNIKKYLFYFVIAVSFHYSAIISLILTLTKISVNKIVYYVLILCLFVLHLFDFSGQIILPYLAMLSSYATDSNWIRTSVLDSGGTGIVMLMNTVICIWIIARLNINDKFEQRLCNIILFYMFIIHTLYIVIPILRLNEFFKVFLICALPLAINKTKEINVKVIVLISLLIWHAVLGIKNIYDSSLYEKTPIGIRENLNIEYDYRINLFQ